MLNSQCTTWLAPPNEALARGHFKRLLTLRYLYTHEFASPSIIQAMIGTKERSYASRLVAKGICATVLVPSLRSGRVVHLTVAGRAAAAAAAGQDWPCAIHPRDLPMAQIRHQLAVQRVCLPWFLEGDTVTPARLLGGFQAEKRPDALLIKPSGLRISIEVELTEKRGAALERALWGCVQGIRDGRWDLVGYHAIDSALLDKYRRRLSLPFDDFGLQQIVTAEEQQKFVFKAVPSLLDDFPTIAPVKSSS